MSNNRLVHFELPAEKPEELSKFYSNVLGWHFNQVPVPGINYWLCDDPTHGPGPTVAVLQRQNATQPVLNYIAVASIEAVIAKAAENGAAVALPRTEVPGNRAIAVIRDPEGNLFGLMEDTSETTDTADKQTE